MSRSIVSVRCLTTALLGAAATVAIWAAVADRASAYIYWGDPPKSSIARSEADGTGISSELVKPGGGPAGIASSGTHIYWANGAIGRSTIGGGSVEKEFLTYEQAHAEGAIAVNGGYLYWHAGDSIARAKLDGSEANRNFIENVELGSWPRGSIAFDSEHIYWTDVEKTSPSEGYYTIGQANINGTEVDHALTRAGPFNGMFVHAGYIYWASNERIVATSLAEPDGTHPLTVFWGEEGKEIGDLVAGDHYIFFTYGPVPWKSGTTSVKRAKLAPEGFFSFPTTIISSAHSGSPGAAIAVDPGQELSPVCEGKSASLYADESREIDLSPVCSTENSFYSLEGGATESFSIVSGPSHGSVSGFNSSTGTLTYKPTHHYIGADSFTFRAENSHGASASATVSLEVEAPEPPSCSPMEQTVPAETTEEIYLGCGGQSITIEIDSEPSHGELVPDPEFPRWAKYTPEASFAGTDSFTFHAENASGESEVTTMELHVEPLICTGDWRTTGVGEPVNLSLSCDGPTPTAFELVGEPSHGTISKFNAVAGTLTYEPEPGFHGWDNFEFQAENSLGSSPPAGFEIGVGNGPECAPVTLATLPDSELPVTLECPGTVGEPYFEIVEEPTHGSISEFESWTGKFVYTPEPGFGGADTIRFRSTDSIAESAVQTLTIDVEPFCHDIEASTYAGAPLPVELDCYGAELSYELGEPEFGWTSGLDPEAGTFTYESDPEFWGEDQIEFSATNAVGESNPATATITVCSRPELDIDGEAADPEAPGVMLEVEADLGPEPCLDEGKPVPIETIHVYIDEEPVYSEERDCDVPEHPCSPAVLARNVQLPIDKIVGNHEVKVETMAANGATSELSYEEETDETATVSTLPPSAEVSAGCKTNPQYKPSRYEWKGKVVVGTDCADVFRVRDGVTKFRGEDGNDVFILGGEINQVLGGEGDDTIYAGRGNDEVFGGADGDRILGGSGDDTLKGGSGNDTIVGGTGADHVSGEGGDDLVRGGGTTDRLEGGAGTNTLSYADGVTPGFDFAPEEPVMSGFPAGSDGRGVYVYLLGPTIGSNGAIARYNGGTDQIKADEFTNIIGTPFADYIVGSEAANVIDGGGGNDIIRGAGQDDRIYGGGDSDYIDGGAGQTTGNVSGGSGDDVCTNAGEGTPCERTEGALVAETAETVSIGSLSPENGEHDTGIFLRGSGSVDKITASWKETKESNEIRFVASGSTPAFTSVGGCEVEENLATCPAAGITTVTLSGAGANDVLKANDFPASVTVTILGGEGGDKLTGGSSADILVDGPGAGNDRLEGFDGDDTFFANHGNDLLFGGDGSDLFVSSPACEKDKIDGGAGTHDNASWAQLRGDPIPSEPGHYDPPDNGMIVTMEEDPGVIERKGGPCEKVGVITAVENLEGSAAADRLVGDDHHNVILGRSGADELIGGGANDSMLANNRDVGGKTKELKEDADEEIKCGDGELDVVRFDPPFDKPAIDYEQCEKRIPSKGTQARISGIGDIPTAEAPTTQLDEDAIGAANRPESPAPSAFYRLDEASGTEAENWSDEEGPGAYEGAVDMDLAGAMDESRAVHLDGAEHIDLGSGLDPASAELFPCDTPSGYTVEMWVKFDSEGGQRETLFSRTSNGNAFSLYRAADGRLSFSVSDPTAAPTVTTEAPVEDGEWHHVVAAIEEVAEPCIEASRMLFSPEGAEEHGSHRLALYVDGFGTALEAPYEDLFPPPMAMASNLVGAEEGLEGPWRWLEGSLDDVAIYTEALSEAEVEAHHAISDAPPLARVLRAPRDLTDTDEDEMPDEFDNCPEDANPEQEDADGNGVGDACGVTPDSDEDGVPDETDNCPMEANALQEDENENGIGDVCEIEEEESEEEGE
jgi:Ca2+-binding RTX toxin-like protein